MSGGPVVWTAGENLPIGTEVIVTEDVRVVRAPERPKTYRIVENIQAGDRVRTNFVHGGAITKVKDSDPMYFHGTRIVIAPMPNGDYEQRRGRKLNDAMMNPLLPFLVQHLEVKGTAYYGSPHVAYKITRPSGSPDVLDHGQVVALRDWLTEWLCIHPDPDE